MAQSDSAKRMLNLLPGLFKVTSTPAVDPTFFGAFNYSIFRPYLVVEDDNETIFTTEPDAHTVSVARMGDHFETGVYGKVLHAMADVGEVYDTDIDVDADLGDSFTLTFLIHPHWNTQPTAASAFYPFRHASSPNPRFGYVENTGTIEAAGWYGETTLGPVSLTYQIGWESHRLFAASLVCDATAGKTYLYVNGVLRATLNEAIRANVVGTLRCHRESEQAGVTDMMKIEGYFAHNKALPAADVTTLHKMFTTGFQSDSRWTRTFLALGMALGELEELAFTFAANRRVEEAEGGALFSLGKDVGVLRRAGEADADLRQRIKNKYLELFSEATPNELILVASEVTGLGKDEILLTLNEDSTGTYAPAFFFVQLPPGNDALLDSLDEALEAAKAAGIRHSVGIKGSFAWDVSGAGWDVGSWNYVV